MKNAILHLLRFLGLLAFMYLLTYVPYGVWANAAVTLAGWWALTAGRKKG